MELINPILSNTSPAKHDRDYLKNNMSNKSKGDLGELLAHLSFEDAIVFANIKTTKYGGDIDLIVILEDIILFTEVKNLNEDSIMYVDWFRSHVKSRFEGERLKIVQEYAERFNITKIVKVLIIPYFETCDQEVTSMVKELGLQIVETHRQALKKDDMSFWKPAIKQLVEQYSEDRSVKNNIDRTLDYGFDYSFRVFFLALLTRKYYLKHFIEHFDQQKTTSFIKKSSDEHIQFRQPTHCNLNYPITNTVNTLGGVNLAKTRGRISRMYDTNKIHEKTLYLLGKLEQVGIRNPAYAERNELMRWTMVILRCSRRNANRWVNFLYRLYFRDWF